MQLQKKNNDVWSEHEILYNHGEGEMHSFVRGFLNNSHEIGTYHIRDPIQYLCSNFSSFVHILLTFRTWNWCKHSTLHSTVFLILIFSIFSLIFIVRQIQNQDIYFKYVIGTFLTLYVYRLKRELSIFVTKSHKVNFNIQGLLLVMLIWSRQIVS